MERKELKDTYSYDVRYYNADDADAVIDAMEASIKELEDKAQMHDFFWEGLGKTWRERGLKNAIGVAQYVENQDKRIKELEQIVDANKMAWVSVKDRLPETNLEVLIWTDGIGVQRADYYVEDEGFCVNEYKHPSYWMPLPNPPKEI